MHRLKSAALVYIFLLLGTAGALSVFWSIRTARHGGLVVAVDMLAFSYVFFGFAAAFVLISRKRVIIRARSDAQGTVLRPDRRYERLMVSITCVAVVALAAYVIFVLSGNTDIPRSQGVSELYYVVLGAAGFLLGTALLRRMSGRGGLSYLRLTSNGFTLEEGFSSTTGKWADVAEVTDRRPGKAQPFRGIMVIVTSDGRSCQLTADSYTSGGRELREMVRFYWQHPDRRDELTDGRALERLRHQSVEE